MLTLFSIPKPFRGHVGVIQRNAIQSWTLIRPRPEIILFGDEDGAAEVARFFGVRHVPEVARNEYGTPLLSDLFGQAQRVATYDLFCYANADIILMSDFVEALQRVAYWRRPFLMVGQRWDLEIGEPLGFSSGWESKLTAHVLAQGVLHPPTGIDYFVFPRGMWRDIPPFAIGRTVWDNWLIYQARAMRVPVVDATRSLMAVHQAHDYLHVPAKAGDVWDGPEAKRNLQLAGGWRHVFTLEDATHVLRRGRPRLAVSLKHLQRRLKTLPTLYSSLKPLTILARPFVLALRRVWSSSKKAHSDREAGLDARQ